MSKVIDLESAMHIRDANESLSDIVDTMNNMSDVQMEAFINEERKKIAAADPTITLGEGPEFIDSKDIYLKTKVGHSIIENIIGLHAVGYAGPYSYTLDNNGEVSTINTNFMAIETFGNEYDHEHNMLGRGSFRLHTNDIEEYAKELEKEGWVRCERPGKK